MRGIAKVEGFAWAIVDDRANSVFAWTRHVTGNAVAHRSHRQHDAGGASPAIVFRCRRAEAGKRLS